MTFTRLLVALTLLVEITGCTTTPSAPLPGANKDRGAVGIRMTIQPIVGGPHLAEVVYFARLDDRAQPFEIYASTFHKEGRVYMLNAPPGRYQAIAAAFRVGLFGPGDTYVTYLSREAIEGTTLTVLPGVLVPMGSVAVKLHIGLCPGEGDAVQLRYAEMLAPGVPKCGLGRMLAHEIGTNVTFVGTQAIKAGLSTFHYRGSLIEVRHDAADREAFRLRAQDDLAGTGWATAPP